MPTINAKLLKDFNALRRLHDSVNLVVEKLELRIKELEDENQKLRNLNETAQQNVDLNKMIVANHLHQTAEKEARLVAEIQQLQREKKELKAQLEV